MQSISPVTSDQLLARDQVSLIKFEIYVGTSWINLCDLDGKDYVEDWSISLGGASMTPNPIGGKFSITLSNENSIFHPKHPTSPFKAYLKTGRKVRISIGAKYDGEEYYWQRLIGYMDKPRFDPLGYKVYISGGDYMKLLQDTELKSPDNYWGSSQTFNSIPSTGLIGSELYTEADAMDINNEGNNVANWVAWHCSFASYADSGMGSTYVGRVTNITEADAFIENTAVGSVTAGKEYKFTFKHRYVNGTEGSIMVEVRQTSGLCAWKRYFPTNSVQEEEFYFTALDTGSVHIIIYFEWDFADLRFDQFSIKEFVPYYNRYYELPSECKGPYRVFLDGEDVWQGEEDEGWYYEENTRRVFFDVNKTVGTGTNNLVIYYFTTQDILDVLADLLVTAGLYANRAAALADMDYTDPNLDIDQVWFDAGKTVLNAVKKICERCGTSGYRFWFKWDGKPSFKPKPTPGTTAFSFTSQDHLESYFDYQDPAEIRNRIIIKGMKRAEPVNREETMPSELKGEAYDQDSIDEHGERTLTIDNHLFQDQTSIDNMCSSLLAERKDPKWYCDVETIYCPVPLEMGDKISFKERLSPSLEVTTLGIIRDIKLSKWSATYPVEVTT